MKKYRLIDNMELWGTEAEYGMIIEEEELLRLADEWGKDVDDLMTDLEEVEEYTVFWIGGEKDGQTIATFPTEREAVEFAKKYTAEHETEFNPCWGGVGITDQEGNDVEW